MCCHFSECNVLFDSYENSVISVRLAKTLPRQIAMHQTPGNENQWKCLCIEGMADYKILHQRSTTKMIEFEKINMEKSCNFVSHLKVNIA